MTLFVLRQLMITRAEDKARALATQAEGLQSGRRRIAAQQAQEQAAAGALFFGGGSAAAQSFPQGRRNSGAERRYTSGTPAWRDYTPRPAQNTNAPLRKGSTDTPATRASVQYAKAA